MFRSMLLAVAAALALGLSAPYASLASGAVLGLLLALVAGWPWLEKTAALPDRSARFNSATTVALAFIMATLVTTFGFAESAPPNGERVAPKSDKIHRLFIPTDEDSPRKGYWNDLMDDPRRPHRWCAAWSQNR